MNLVLRGEIEEAKQLIADGADVNQGTWFSENLIVISMSIDVFYTGIKLLMWGHKRKTAEAKTA